MSKGFISALAIASAWLAGCASLFSGSSQQVEIGSIEPQKFIVESEDGDVVETGTTPRVVTLDTWRNYRVLGLGPGGEIYRIHSGVSGWYIFGNLLNGIGYFIDPITGAMWALDVDRIYFREFSSASGLSVAGGGAAATGRDGGGN